MNKAPTSLLYDCPFEIAWTIHIYPGKRVVLFLQVRPSFTFNPGFVLEVFLQPNPGFQSAFVALEDF